MLRIELQAVPNQRFTFEQGENRWEIRIGTAKASMFCDITLNDQIILQGSRIVAETPLIPYPHLAEQGNFVLLTDDGDAPWWESFEGGQRLVYATKKEVDEMISSRYVDIRTRKISTSNYDLVRLINRAMRLKPYDYTPASWANLQSVLGFALLVASSDRSTESEIIQATKSLQIAIDSLVTIEQDIMLAIDRLHILVHQTLPSPNYW